MPAFKPGEKVQLPMLSMQDDVWVLIHCSQLGVILVLIEASLTTYEQVLVNGNNVTECPENNNKVVEISGRVKTFVYFKFNFEVEKKQ